MTRQRNSKGRFGTEEMIGPTPETLAKLKPDVLLNLTLNQVLTVDQERAGREIAQIWRAIMRGMFGSFNPEGARVSGARRDPAGAMTEYEAIIHARTYLPWARAEAERVVIHWPRLDAVKLAYEVCAANRSLAELAQQYKTETYFLCDALKRTLSAYERRLADRKVEEARARDREAQRANVA